jgi:hypothetical protein
MTEKKRPIMNFGPYPTDRNTSIEVSVWQNQIDANEGTVTTYNVTVQRSYRDGKGTWQKNATFRPHDIPVIIHGLQKAYDYILEIKNAATE